MKDHLTLIKMAIIKQRESKKCWLGYEETGNLAHCWWHVKYCRCYGTVWQVLQKLKICDPAILRGIYPKEFNIT